MSERDNEQLRRWLAETESDCESIIGVEDPDEVEEDFLEEHDDLSDSDEAGEEAGVAEEEDESMLSTGPESQTPSDESREFYIGRQRSTEPTRWYLEPQIARTSRTPRCNIIPSFHRPGPVGNAKNAATPLDALLCLIDDEMIHQIVECTNIYIENVKAKFTRERDAKLTDDLEVKSLLGILYLIGVIKSGRRNVIDLWNNSYGTGCDAVYLTMSEHRFRFLMRSLRFDNIHDRGQRRSLDKLAPIRLLFDKFVSNSVNSFKPTDYLTIDEQLVAFRGRCPFRQYMPKKPAKFGIKVYALVSASNFYATKLEVYVGKQPNGPHQISNRTEDLVDRLVEPIVGSHRNITADNFFSSVPMALRLLEEKSITYVGTLRKNKPEIPACFLPDVDREPKSSLFGFQKKCTLVSYVPAKKRAVCAISTMHNTKSIDADTGAERKPCIITTYNDTKHGVDILDKMCRQYDVSRNSRRWPLTLFFHIMNVAGVNALVIHRANKNYIEVIRREFLQNLALDLLKPAVHRRITQESLPREIKRRAKIFLGIEEEVAAVQPPTSAMGRCFLCGRSRNKTTRRTCSKCNHWVCPEHQKIVCASCTEQP